MNKDLTVGKPETVLWQFCLPLFGSIIFQQLYNIADSLVAGKFIGENALAAVGNSYEITLIFIAFAFGCNIGCSVIVSRLFGSKKYGEMKTSVYTTMISSAVLCAFLMIFGLVCCDALLALIHTPPEILFDSKLYLNIYIWGLPFLFFYNIATGIFSALGDSKTPFIFLAISSTANILVDILFVAAFDMGVTGVAWATFLCQGVSCVLAVIVVLKRLSAIPTEGRVVLYSFEMFKKIAVIAVPSILQQSFISVGNIIIQSVINDCGVEVTAGYAAAIKLNNLVITSFTTLANGLSNYTAQNIGAGILPRIRDGFKAGVKMVWLLCVPLVALYLTATKALVTFFINDPSELALASGMRFLYIVAPFYFIISVKLIADGILRGAGLMKNFMIATFTDLILRVVLAEILSGQIGYIGIWCAWPIGWTLATGLSITFYRRGPWREK
ncbi:MAG: MATE family efflux transporter [Lachnospiraceae bacterium]|nr:MATE family efflux transporter [Lachnospiraceae bacterium]